MAVRPQLTPHERGLAMAMRVHETVVRNLGADVVARAADAHAAGRLTGADAAVRVHRAVLTALLARHQLDPQDARYLHPARTVLILLDDCGVLDPAALAAGALLETWHRDLAAVPDRLDEDAAALLARVPRPDATGDDDRLREALVSADDDARLIALVERLDHARHLHLYPRPEWQPLFDNVQAAYLPVAEWLGGLIGARYRRWADAFARRL